MKKSYYKGYWMATNRCNLRCSYCVLENAPDQLRAELDLESKKEFVSHLYNNLDFRRLTLSGGEVLIFGKKPPEEFIELLRHIRSFRSADREKNLEIEVYTNGTYLSDRVADEMKGVVDLVAVTIDSAQEEFLMQIGRTNRKFNRYFEQIIQVSKRLAERGIELKLHSVISQKNHMFLTEEIVRILDAMEATGGKVAAWKFFQYMSYDSPERDRAHAIDESTYNAFKEKAKRALAGRHPKLHFKDNKEMNNSLFNILSYGNAQYMCEGDSWTTSRRTEDLRNYSSMQDLFAKHEIDESRFRAFHEIKR
ncbi:MAG: radical SAM protein [Candidatus Algichlamydia australiensis]|nr:radical SAM protein [Chlamydiales bacterium]